MPCRGPSESEVLRANNQGELFTLILDAADLFRKDGFTPFTFDDLSAVLRGQDSGARSVFIDALVP